MSGWDPSGRMTLFQTLSSLYLGVDLRKNEGQNGVHQGRRAAATLCSISARFAKRFNDLCKNSWVKKWTRLSGFQSHHVFQDAAMEVLHYTYKRSMGFAIPLLGGSGAPGSPHAMANAFQISNAGKNIRYVAFGSLRAAGCRASDATEIFLMAENWNKINGWI